MIGKRRDTRFYADEASNNADVAELVSGLRSRLSNVKKYHLYLYNPSSNHDYLFLHTAIWPLLTSLESLSIELQVERLDELALLLGGIESLRELDVTIFFAREMKPNGGLIEFVNNHCRTLRSLTFESGANLDFFHIFSSFVYFPQLIDVNVDIPLFADNYGLQLSGLRHFLIQHSHILQRLHLHPASWGDLDVWIEWIVESFSGVTLGALQSLEITLCTRFPETLDIIFPRIPPFAPNLSSLVLKGQYMMFHDVQDLSTHFFGSRLTRLSCGVSLSPEIVDVLAAQLPQLETLHLLVYHVKTHKDAISSDEVSSFRYCISSLCLTLLYRWALLLR